MILTDEDLLQMGYPFYKRFADGSVAAYDDRTFGAGAILWPLTDICHANEWMYDHRGKAVAALLAWNGTGEPEGWVRHSPSMRRTDANGTMYVNPGDKGEATHWFYQQNLAAGVERMAALVDAARQTVKLIDAWQANQKRAPPHEPH